MFGKIPAGSSHDVDLRLVVPEHGSGAPCLVQRGRQPGIKADHRDDRLRTRDRAAVVHRRLSHVQKPRSALAQQDRSRRAGRVVNADHAVPRHMIGIDASLAVENQMLGT